MRIFCTICCCLLFHLVIYGQEIYFPPMVGDDWETVDPATLNWASDRIDTLYAYLEREDTKAFLLLKDGRIVLEHYFGTFTSDSLWVWFSAGKSLRALLVGIAQEEGFLDIEDPTSDYLGEGWSNLSPARESQITVWNQLTMTSGLDERFFTCIDPVCLRYRADAGTRWVYHNGPYNLLKDVLEAATDQPINTYTTDNVQTPIGMRSGFWLPSGDNTFFLSRARDMARFGILIQNDGVWDGRPVIRDTVYFNQMIRPSQGLNPSYGYLWWLNGQPSHILPNSPLSREGYLAPDAPLDAITAAGGQGQFVSIVPSEGLVMVRMGLSTNTGLAAIELLNEIWKRIGELEVVTSTESAPIEGGIQVFPNPATDWLQVSGVDSFLQIHLYDAFGRLLITSDTAPLSLSGLAAGLYVVEVETAAGVVYRRLVIN